MTQAQRNFCRQACWTAAFSIGIPVLVLNVMMWTGHIALPENLTGWVMVAILLFSYAGHQVGKERPQIVQLADLNAITRKMDSIPELVRDEVERTVKRAFANVYVDSIGNGARDLRLVRNADDRSPP